MFFSELYSEDKEADTFGCIQVYMFSYISKGMHWL